MWFSRKGLYLTATLLCTFAYVSVILVHWNGAIRLPQELPFLGNNPFLEFPSEANDDCAKVNSTLYWRTVAMELAMLPAKDLLKRLENDDPFGVRGFETMLIAQEIALGRTLTVPEVKQLFPCPRCLLSSRIDTASHPSPSKFRNGHTWLLFQHLRKAGGTHFCSLVGVNLPRASVPSFFCMPDKRWEEIKQRQQGKKIRSAPAGWLKKYTNNELISYMQRDKYKIAMNEWDPFPSRFLDLPVATATSFRKPLDRVLSQFRFECIEGRGCIRLNITEWFDNHPELYNYYLTTFTDPPTELEQIGKQYSKRSWRYLATTYLSDTPAHAFNRSVLIGKALDVVLQLHLVLVMEWSVYAAQQISSVLGFRNTTGLAQRVLPFIWQRPRNDTNAVIELGAAGSTKDSWDPKSYLTEAQYQHLSELLALDMVLNDAARRIFLERLVCNSET